QAQAQMHPVRAHAQAVLAPCSARRHFADFFQMRVAHGRAPVSAQGSFIHRSRANFPGPTRKKAQERVVAPIHPGGGEKGGVGKSRVALLRFYAGYASPVLIDHGASLARLGVLERAATTVPAEE